MDSAQTGPHVIPFTLRDWLYDELKEMLDHGLRELSNNSTWNLLVHIVKKNGKGQYRLSFDYRYLKCN